MQLSSSVSSLSSSSSSSSSSALIAVAVFVGAAAASADAAAAVGVSPRAYLSSSSSSPASFVPLPAALLVSRINNAWRQHEPKTYIHSRRGSRLLAPVNEMTRQGRQRGRGRQGRRQGRRQVRRGGGHVVGDASVGLGGVAFGIDSEFCNFYRLDADSADSADSAGCRNRGRVWYHWRRRKRRVSVSPLGAGANANATPLTDTKPPPRPMHLYNSLTRSKSLFVPQHPPHVSMYTCGPTVYDRAHVGNFRAFLTYDVLKRVLLYLGYDVTHVCNLTDVDDKIIARCERDGTTLMDLTRRFEEAFMLDLDALNVIKANVYPRATEHIDDMIQMVLELERNGLAYKSGSDATANAAATSAAEGGDDDTGDDDGIGSGSWYFDVGKKIGYGQQLVDLDVASMKRGASGMAGMARRLHHDDDDDDDNDINDNDQHNNNDNNNDDEPIDDYDSEKRSPRDFVLWKAYKPNFDRDDAVWDAPTLGPNSRGRPGWHLECSAMARRYLGDTIDIHCGGIDLKFPHHENEIAQSEGATGKPFCNCWIHNGFVNINNEKMSKSKGNFIALNDACPTANDVRAYRYLVISSQYRNPLSLTDAAMAASKGALKRLDNIKARIDNALRDGNDGSGSGSGSGNGNDNYDETGNAKPTTTTTTNNLVEIAKKALSDFEDAISDDLSMPRASASLFALVKAAENEFKRYQKALDKTTKKEVEEEKEEEEEEEEEKKKKKAIDRGSGKSNTIMIGEALLNLEGLSAIRDALMQMDLVFGIFYDVPMPVTTQDYNSQGQGVSNDNDINDNDNGDIPEQIMKLVKERADAKNVGNYAKADELRERIGTLGFAIKDIKGGDSLVTRL